MQLSVRHRNEITTWFCVIFYVLMIFKWLNGMFLYQIQPFIYTIRFDLVTWNLMQTGLHQWLMANQFGLILFDILFYSMPLVLWITSRFSLKSGVIVAIVMLIINWIHIQCYTLYPTNSIESYTAWLLFPLLFMAVNLRNFYFMLHSLRYFFLFFIASAGIWKLVQLGAFNPQQMTGVLLYQHKEYLTSSPDAWYSHFIYSLIRSKGSYLLYLLGIVIELSFIIGFFTRKYDKIFIAAFILFLLFDVLIMRIHYWETLPFLLTLIYSKYTMPDDRRYSR